MTKTNRVLAAGKIVAGRVTATVLSGYDIPDGWTVTTTNRGADLGQIETHQPA